MIEVKSVFFLLNSMNVGGVEKAFLNMIHFLPKEKYDIHLGLLSSEGDYRNDIPSYVQVHDIFRSKLYKSVLNVPPLQVVQRLLREGCIFSGLLHLLFYFLFKITKSRLLYYKYVFRKVPVFPMSFDIAVAYAGPSQLVDFYITNKVRAKKKCGWIHFDIDKIGIDEGMIKSLYVNYQKIFIVSNVGKEHFDDRFPQFKDKTEVFYNIVSPELILKMAENAPTFSDTFYGKRILTVGRISDEKGTDFAIRALKILLESNKNVKWYFVGDGSFRKHCERLTHDLELEEHVVFLGTEKNPYGYMRDCDVYVQPSRHEGYCITLAEARVFANPIVATNFTGAREQLANRKNGVVTGFSERDISFGILKSLSLGLDEGNVFVDFHTDIDKLLNL